MIKQFSNDEYAGFVETFTEREWEKYIDLLRPGNQSTEGFVSNESIPDIMIRVRQDAVFIESHGGFERLSNTLSNLLESVDRNIYFENHDPSNHSEKMICTSNTPTLPRITLRIENMFMGRQECPFKHTNPNNKSVRKCKKCSTDGSNGRYNLDCDLILSNGLKSLKISGASIMMIMNHHFFELSSHRVDPEKLLEILA